MQRKISIKTDKREGLYDITQKVRDALSGTKIKTGLVSIYVQGATAAIMIQENWDQSVQEDMIDLLNKQIPRGVWKHDAQDGNGDAHLKAGLIGPGETVPIIDGKLGLSRWQNIFLCEFDGPREARDIILTFIAG